MFSATEFPPPSISLPRWFLLLAVSGLFYLTRKGCKIDHTIWLGIEEIGCSSQRFYITYWCCIGVTVIDTRAHLPPYYNLTEATHNQNMSISRSWRLSWLWGERSHGRDPSHVAIFEVESKELELELFAGASFFIDFLLLKNPHETQSLKSRWSSFPSLLNEFPTPGFGRIERFLGLFCMNPSKFSLKVDRRKSRLFHFAN